MERVEKLLSTGQAAHRLSLSPQRVRQLLDQGKLEGVWTPLGRLVDIASIERLLAEREGVVR